jgi:hypothetical protein
MSRIQVKFYGRLPESASALSSHNYRCFPESSRLEMFRGASDVSLIGETMQEIAPRGTMDLS